MVQRRRRSPKSSKRRNGSDDGGSINTGEDSGADGVGEGVAVEKPPPNPFLYSIVES
jgi:hypothetical protein